MPALKKTYSDKSMDDIEKSSLEELLEARAKIDKEINNRLNGETGEQDVDLFYYIYMCSPDKNTVENKGHLSFSKILHPRLLAEAPMRFESQWHQQIFSPINAALYDVIDKHNTTGNSITGINQYSGSIPYMN